MSLKCTMKTGIGLLGILLLIFELCSTQVPEVVKRPTFPDVFHVEVQGIFMNQKMEVDGSMYYDKVNNRAAISFTFQNELQTYIYNFNEDAFIQIDGNDCQVSEIDSEAGTIFFPFTVKDKKKVMGPPEEVMHFTNSVLDRQDISVFPSYVYTSKEDFPSYGRSNCDVTHIFSKPEVELPDCEGHSCKPTLVAISVKCPAVGEDMPPMDHTYNFFRFRSGHVDPAVFQVPEGLYCDMKNKRSFPAFPDYFSFTYDRYEDQKEEESGVYAVHKKVWYDTKLKLIRMDQYDNDGLLTSSRIFDFYGGTAYAIIASLSDCEKGPLDDDVALDQMTQLPKIFFKRDVTEKDALYIGKRESQGMSYDVWSLTYTDKQTDAMVVEEFYFINSIIKQKDENYTKTHTLTYLETSLGPGRLQISHANIYTYQKNDDTGLYELSVLTRLTINNFRSQPKAWEAFDVSSCFSNDEKKGFKLKVEGPPTVKDSRTYEEILEKMYMRIIIATNVSVVRINELTGVFDGVKISEFTGWILNKTQTENSATGKLEPDMNSAYKMIEDAATAGKLSFKIKRENGEEVRYKITAIEEKNEIIVDPKNLPKKDCFSGGSMAAASLVLLILGISIGAAGYYVFIKRHRSQSDDKVQLHSM